MKEQSYNVLQTYSEESRGFIVGTAGHIDHGKTALIKALTGCDTDRLAEEKKRGITIELGFAALNLPSGRQAGIIDVPGHEKFISNMAAGVVGMDLVLLVIAADEGIMPQTLEHVDILELLGVQKGILVISKIDLVEQEWLDMVEEEIRREFSDTFLKEAPLVKVSSVSGQGLEELLQLIDDFSKEDQKRRDIHGICRLPVDRVFTMTGFGTIVTGTLLGGTISKEDVLEIYPIGKEARVRSIQVHGKEVEQCFAGQRVAINISNIKKEDIKRGCVLALSGSMKNARMLDVKLQVLKSSKRILKNNTRLHLFTGTKEVLCRAVLLENEELKPGESGYAQLRLEEDVAVKRNDKFIVRFYSPLETIGGGIILEPDSVKKKRFKEDVINELKKKETGSVRDVLELYLKAHKEVPIPYSELIQQVSAAEEEIREEIRELENEKHIVLFPMRKENYVWHIDSFEERKQVLGKKLKAYKEEHPYRYGMKKSEIYTLCFPKMKQNVFDKMIEKMIEQDIIKRQNEFLALSEQEIERDGIFKKVSEIYLNELKKAAYDFVKISEIVVSDCSEASAADIRNVLEEEQQIVKIAEDVYTLKIYADQVKEKAAKHFQENEILTVVQIKEMFCTSRKNAKLILEYMDQERITRKTGAETERTAY